MILHDWDDKHCLKVLKDCHTALPSDGLEKLIIVEMLMLEETPVLTGSSTPMDIFSSCSLSCSNGRERSKAKYEHLAKRAGFTAFKEVGQLGKLCVMESLK